MTYGNWPGHDFPPQQPQPSRPPHQPHQLQQPQQPQQPASVGGSKTGAVLFAVLSAVGLLLLIVAYLVMGYLFFWGWRRSPIVVLGCLLILVGMAGAITLARCNRKAVASFGAVQAVGILLMFLFTYTLVFVGLVVLLVGTVGIIVSAARSPSPRVTPRTLAPQPLGYTDDGRPFYPIVGYTSDGTPVTADRAQGFGYVGANAGSTNSMAITALILAFVFTPLAIPFGHIARGRSAALASWGPAWRSPVSSSATSGSF